MRIRFELAVHKQLEYCENPIARSIQMHRLYNVVNRDFPGIFDDLLQCINTYENQ